MDYKNASDCPVLPGVFIDTGPLRFYTISYRHLNKEIVTHMENRDEYLQHLASTTNLIKKILLSYGLNPDVLFWKAGIDPSLLKDPQARIATRKVNALWELATREIDDPCFAVDSGKHWHPSFINALGYSWLTSATLKDALEKCVRYFALISNTSEIALTPIKNGMEISLTYDQDYPPHPNRRIAFLSIILAMCRSNYGNTLCPVKVRVVQSPPECAELFYNYFKTKVVFSAPVESIIFSTKDLNRSLPGGNPLLEKMHDQVIREYLGKLSDRRIATKVASEIAGGMSSGKITDDYVAGRLAMSVRSLHRKLQKEGTRFQSVFDSTRENMARKYFKDPNLKLEEIAYLTGFSEYSSFSRAFKRWTGVSPSKIRSSIRG